MTELEVMQRARMYMDKLARGIDPITDQPLPGDTALNQARLSRCFAYVSEVLGRVIANGGNVGSNRKTQPFTISAEQLAMVQLSREPVTVSQLIESLSAAVNNPEMRRPSTTVITNWLLQQGFLEKRTTPEGKNTRVPTPKGQSIGLTSETRQGREGEYQMVFYDLGAQRFVLDHLSEMLQQ